MEDFVNTGQTKGRIIKTISVTPEDDALITELNLSLSGVMRQKLAEIRNYSENWNKKILERETKIRNLIGIIEKYANFIEKKGLTGEWENDV